MKYRSIHIRFRIAKRSIGLKNEELLAHSERFVDYWIKETFIWILAALFMANITANLNSEVFLALAVRGSNLHQSAIAWSSYSVALVSICSYEIERGKLRPSFQCESP